MSDEIFTGNDAADAYFSVIQDDPRLRAIFPEGFREEDPGDISAKEGKLIAITVIAEGHNDASTGGATHVNTYQLGVMIYVSDKERTPAKKRELVQLTGIVKRIMMSLPYRSDPDRRRAAWYKSGFAQPICTRYRKTETHQSSVTVIELRNRKRSLS